MGKGVLLELAGREAVVLTPQGDFKRVPVPKGSWDIGDEIEFAETKATPWARWASIAAAAAVMVLAPLGWQSYTLAQPAAIVTVDINPSLQLTLNKKDQVLKVQALNDDGALILDGVEWKRQPVDEVVAAVTAQAVAQQKLSPADQGGTVVVAVVPPAKAELPKGQADRIRDKAYEAVTSVVPETNVAVLEVSVDEKAAAEAVGLNPGKFVLYKTLEENGAEVKPEDLLQSGPGKVLKDLGINPSTIFSQAEKDHGGPPAKAKEKNKSKSDTNPAATPVVAPADDKQNDDDKKSDDDDKKADDDKKSDDDKKGNGQSDDNSGKGNSGSDNKGQSNSNSGKGNSDSAPARGKDKQDKSDQDDSSGKAKKSGSGKQSWTVPFIGITIDKPVFLRDRDTEAEDVGSPATGSPRAETPGAGSSDKSGKGSDKSDRDSEQENGAAGKNGKGKGSN